MARLCTSIIVSHFFNMVGLAGVKCVYLPFYYEC